MFDLGPKQLVVVIAGATVLSGFSLVSILVYSDPRSAGILLFLFLYFSVFLFALGIFSLFGLALRRLWHKRGLFSVNLSNSLRQGLFLSFYLVTCLALSANGLLFWWVAACLFLPLALLEAFLNLKI